MVDKYCSNCNLYNFTTNRCPHGSTVSPNNVCCDKWEEIIPCKHFSYNDSEEYYQCDHYGNMWFPDGEWMRDPKAICKKIDGCEQYHD